MPNKFESNLQIKQNPGQINIDKAEGIVECFVAGIGNKDSVGDIIQPGAFTESLKRRKPRVVWGHSWNDPIGKVLEIYEVGPNDPRLPEKMKKASIGGLYAKVQFNLSTEKGREAFASVAFFGKDQEWSIGYKTLQATFDPSRQANILREVELYECSPVLHGANQLTGTISVKNDPIFFADIDNMVDSLQSDEDESWFFEHDGLAFDEKGDRLRDPKGGLTAAGRRHFARTEGANLKPGVMGAADTPQKMRRKGSFLTRFFTNPSGPMKKPNGKPTRLALSAAAWGEPVPKNMADAAKLAAKGRRLLERYENTKKKDDYDYSEDFDFFDDVDDAEFQLMSEDEKCHYMGQQMPDAIRQRWQQMIAARRREEQEEEESNSDIFEDGLATPLSPEKRNALLMEMSRRSQYPIEIIEASENLVVFHAMKGPKRMTFRMSYHREDESGSYMFGKPERVMMEFVPTKPEQKPEIDIPRRMARPDEDETMPRLLRIIQKFDNDEKSLLEPATADFLETMEIDIKAGRVISTRNMNKLKNIVSLLQEVISSAGEIEEKDALLIPCEIHEAFSTKSHIDPILDYYGATAEVTEQGIVVKSGATPEFRAAIQNAMGNFSYKAMGGRIGGGGGKGRRAARFATARFDPNAVDGDNDGLVQEGTAFERPATPGVKPLANALGNQQPKTPKSPSGGLSEARRFGRPTTDRDPGKRARELDETIRVVLENRQQSTGGAETPFSVLLNRTERGEARSNARAISSNKPFALLSRTEGRKRSVAPSTREERNEDRLREMTDRMKRLQSGKYDARDSEYWEITGDGALRVRRTDDGKFVRASQEDPKLASAIREKFDRGNSISELMDENNMSRSDVVRSIIENHKAKKGIPTSDGLSSRLERGDGMIQRDERGRTVFDSQKFRNELAERRENRLRELGFNDEEIETLLGYKPATRPEGLSSKGRWHIKEPSSNMSELESRLDALQKFWEDNPDFNPLQGGETDEAYDDLYAEWEELDSAVDEILSFYSDENGRWQDADTRLDDAKIDIEEATEEIDKIAAEINSDREELSGLMEGMTREKFIREFETNPFAKNDEAEYERYELGNWYDDLVELFDKVNESQIDLYIAQGDKQQFETHGHPRVAGEFFKVADKKAARDKDRDRAKRYSKYLGSKESREGFSSARPAGNGLGTTRQIYPTPGAKASSAVNYIHYDAGAEEMYVRYKDGTGFYIFGGISEMQASAIENAPSIGSELSKVKRNSRYTIKPNGDVVGNKPTPSQRLTRTRDRVTNLGGLDRNETDVFNEAIDALDGKMDSMSDADRLAVAKRISDLANNMRAREEDYAEALLRDAAGAARPTPSKTGRVDAKGPVEVTLTDDQIGDIRKSIGLASQRVTRNRAKEGLASYVDAATNARNGSVRMDKETYGQVIDGLQALDYEGIDYPRQMRDVLELAAIDPKGKYVSPQVAEARSNPLKVHGFSSRRPNNGAPDDIPQSMQDEFIFWAKRQGGFGVVRRLAEKYDAQDGELSPKDWIRLHDYYANYSPRGKGMPLYGSKRSGLSSEVAPRKRGRPVGEGDDKRFRGKTWAAVKPADWELMSPEEQEEELFTNLKPENSGLREADWKRLVNETAERSLEAEESPAARRRRRLDERMVERRRNIGSDIESMSDADRDRAAERAQARATESQTPEVAEEREITPKDAKAARKKILRSLDNSINKQRDNARSMADSGEADELHAEAWEDVLSILTDSDDLTMSQLDSLVDSLENYLEEVNSLDELTPAEARSVRTARSLLSRVEDLQEQFSDDPFIQRGTTEASEKLGRQGDEFIDEVERNGFASVIKPYKKNISAYLNARDQGFSSEKAGRTEVKGQATFFKNIEESIPKEIREAEKNGDRATAKGLKLLEQIIKRQGASKTGSKRTDAGEILVNQSELDEIMDAIMVVIDRQMSIGGEERMEAFARLLDMMARSGMATFINKTQEEIGSRTQQRTNSQGRSVNIPNT